MQSLLKCAGVLSLALFVSLLAPSRGAAQIPNAGFETWNAGIPDGWITTNLTGIATPVTASDTRRTGSFAARGEVLFVSNTLVPPALYSNFPQTQLPQRLQLYYQFAPQGGGRIEYRLALL